MQVIRQLFIAVFAAAFALSAAAQVQQARGKATVPYTGKAVTPEVKAKALQGAQLKAISQRLEELGRKP